MTESERITHLERAVAELRALLAIHPPLSVAHDPIPLALAIVSRRFSLNIHRIRGRQRDQTTVDARWAVFWLLHERFGINARQIGLALGRHHGTILHALENLRANVSPRSHFRRLLVNCELDLEAELAARGEL